VQEVFVRALERLSTLREPDRFRPWLLAIARHAAIDQRRAQKHPHAAAAKSDDEPTDLPASEPLPEEVAELHELAHLVDSCVANLSSRDATAISLVTHFGFTPADLACALGISVGAARVLTHRARQRLRDGLALELMVRRHRGCDEFKALIDTDELLAGARHVRACDKCSTVVREEIALFSAQPLNRQTARAQ
jgi:RNA polymerase sigma factor (sigma-70 family)